MNISIYKTHKVFTYLVFLLLPLWGGAQVIEHRQVVMDDSLSVTYNGCFSIAVQVNQAPANGDYAINGLINAGPTWGGLLELTYYPNPGFLGTDTMIVTHCNQSGNGGGGGAVTTVMIIDVVAGIVQAQDDWATTLVDSTTNIDVLGNDTGSGTLYVHKVPLVNHGTVTLLPDNTIDFAPQEGFSGVAQFHYTVCIAPNICDVGIVTVFVERDATMDDTVYIATNRNTPLNLLVQQSHGFQLLDAPNYGTVVSVDQGTLRYKPLINYIGPDVLRCAYNTDFNTSLVTFIIDVLNAPGPDGFAKDDYAFSAIDGMVDIAVLANDEGINLGVGSINVSPAHGTYSLSNGVIHYIPDPGFSGVDYMRYTACTPIFNCAKADVYIFVGNQIPSPSSYDLSTPINTPLVINYNIPIMDWTFVLSNQSSSAGGNLAYQSGYYNGLINGQQVSGYNLLIYTPPVDFLGTDIFQFQYCVGADCQTVDISVNVTPSPNINIDTFCINDCVWAGDANYDGVANIKDLLPIGYCIGDVGFSRPNASIDQWYGQFGDNWEGELGGQNEVNLKHVDTNGDGIISAEDTVALGRFYGNYHNLSPENNAPVSNTPLYFVTRTPNPGPGDLVTVDIVLGNANFPGINLYGFTFPLDYNIDNIVPNSLNVRFLNDNWLAYNSPTLSLTNEQVVGHVDVGYTRTTGRPVSGYGIIGKIDFIIEDVVDGAKLRDSLQSRIQVGRPTAMTGDGQYAQLTAEDLWFTIYLDGNEKKDLSDEDLIAYPNPAQDQVSLHLNGRNALRKVALFSVIGQPIATYEAEGKHLDIDISDLQNGIYILSVVTDRGYISKKIEVMKGDY